MPWAQFDEDGNYHETAYRIVRCETHRTMLCGGIGAMACGVMWLVDKPGYFAGTVPSHEDTPVECGARTDDGGKTCAQWRKQHDEITAQLMERHKDDPEYLKALEGLG